MIVAATLQIEEGALTGESVAVEKSIDAITAPDVPSAFARAWLAVEVADFEAGAWNQ